MMDFQGKPPAHLWWANAAVHAAIVLTHYFGPLYSGAILGGVLLTGAVRRFPPFRVAGSILLGWAVFLPWWPVFLRHREMANPFFWIAVPDPGILRQYYGHFIDNDYGRFMAPGLGGIFLAGLCLALAGGGGRWRRGWPALVAIRRRELALLLLVPGFAAVPLITYYFSTRPGGASFFLDRYLLCVALGWAVLCAHLIHRALLPGILIRHFRLRRIFVAAQAAAVAVGIGWGVWGLYRQDLATGPRAEYEDILLQGHLYDKIVVEHIHEYLLRNYYSTWPERYQFVVDEETGIREGGGGVANHRIMAGLKRQFPESFAGVFPNAEFLSLTPNFWIKHNLATRWWELRIASNPQFSSEPAAEGMIHITRRPPRR